MKNQKKVAKKTVTKPSGARPNYPSAQWLSELLCCRNRLGLGLAALCGPLLATSGSAADASAVTKPAGIQKPAWLSDLSVTAKESYDDNVYLAEYGTLANLGSWVSTISPKVGVNFAPLLGEQTVLEALSLAYAPDFSFYHEEQSESYNAHRALFATKGKAGSISFNAENSFSYVDGDEEGPIYDRGRSAYATGAPRERREQYQDRAKVTFQYDQEKWFVRPTAALMYFDLLTDLRSQAGYDNYCDRYDVNGGVDFGYKLDPKLAVTLGYRYGHQYQQQYEFDPSNLSSSSDYNRVLVGFEGKPWKWLTFGAQAGPDFRSYEDDTANHTTPLDDHDPVTYYAEASVAAEVSAKDVITFKYKQWQWLSSLGKLPTFESCYDLGYRHKFNKKLSLDLGGRLLAADYTIANVPASKRNDMQYTVTAGVTYAFNSHLSANVAYALDLGQNAQDGLTSIVAAEREYEHNLVSVGVNFKF